MTWAADVGWRRVTDVEPATLKIKPGRMGWGEMTKAIQSFNLVDGNDL